MATQTPPSNPPLPPSDVPAFKRSIRKSSRLPKDAPDQVGESVVTDSPVTKPKRRKRETVVDTSTPDVVSLDPQAEWVDEPTMVDQIKNDSAWKFDRGEVKVYNLSDEKQLGEYNALLARCGSPTTNCFVVEERKEFAPALGTWSCMVKVQYVKYRKILKTTKT